MEPSQPVFIIPSQCGKHASPLYYKMSIEVGQYVLGLHIFRNLAEEIIMAAVNMSKRGPIICVNS